MPRGPRELTISFGANALTHYGGVYLLHRFFSRVGFKHALAHDLRVVSRNTRYTVGEMVLALLYPMILGLERLETTQLLRCNGVFQYLTGLPRYPDPQTLRRFLVRATPALLARLCALHDRCRQRIGARPRWPARFIFDLDSTVLPVYGHQEGAARGYNPAKHGRRSYHPLLCFEGQTRDYWHGELRPGDAYSGSGAIDLLTAVLAKVPAAVQDRPVVVRGDKGFYEHTFLEWLDALAIRFVVVARLTRPIQRLLPGLRYQTDRRGLGVAEFAYQPSHFSRPFRFVAIRRPQPDEDGDQLTLFTLARHQYQVFITTLPLTPRALWRFYNQRAGLELIIRELKSDYPLGRIPTHDYAANQAYFELLLLAYHLMNWFKRLCLPPSLQRARLETLRREMLCMPAYLATTHNRPRLMLPASGKRETAWTHALDRLSTLRP